MRIIFAGTSEFAAYHLNTLISSNYQIVGVFTRPDNLAGRGMKIKSTPVKILAKRYGLPVFQPTFLYLQEVQQIITNLNADIIVVVAYGLIFPQKILEIPRLGCINVHCSLLPRWRGSAPVQRSLCAGDTETGITIIQMDVGLDTGDILYQSSCPITANDTSGTLYAKLEKLGSNSLIKTLRYLVNGNLKPKKQDEKQASYAKKINKKEARINWFLFASQLERCIRAFNPWPISWLEVSNQPPIKVWKASVVDDINYYRIPGTIIKADKQGIQVSTAKGILNLESLQLAGKKIMSVADILNSNYKLFLPGKHLF